MVNFYFGFRFGCIFIIFILKVLYFIKFMFKIIIYFCGILNDIMIFILVFMLDVLLYDFCF